MHVVVHLIFQLLRLTPRVEFAICIAKLSPIANQICYHCTTQGYSFDGLLLGGGGPTMSSSSTNNEGNDLGIILLGSCSGSALYFVKSVMPVSLNISSSINALPLYL